jgi:choline dehydrogenase-like flavoprotein
MICDLATLPDAVSGTHGVLIIGSGPVGLVIARHLAELGVAATVLEAGGELPSAVDRDCLNIECSDQTLTGAQLGRTRQLGGGLNLWGGQLARFHAATLDGPSSAWPIAASELAGPFDIAARLLGAPTREAPPPAAIADMREGIARQGLEAVATRWLAAPKWRHSVWSELRRSARIRIVLGAAVSAITLDATRGEVTGVVVRRRDGRQTSFAGRTVIIAAGTIESVRLLLQPAADGRPQPWHDLPWLGRGFSEHLEAMVARIAVKSPAKLADFFDPVVGPGSKETWKLFGRVQLPEGEDACGVMMLSAPGNLRHSLAELRLLLRTLTPRDMPRSLPKLLAAAASSTREVGPLALRYVRHRRIGAYFRGSPSLRASVEQRARFDNRLELAADCDLLGIRRVRLQWHTGRAEGVVFQELALRAARWLEAEGIGRADLDPRLLADPEDFARSADEGLHPAGGACLSVSARDGVVDRDLQVHGVSGLYVCGACVFPRMGYANPTLPAAALGVRLAQKLALGATSSERSAA